MLLSVNVIHHHHYCSIIISFCLYQILPKRLLGEGLVTSEGEYHHRQRKIIQPAFHPDLIKKYGDISYFKHFQKTELFKQKI
jgi:cytochrome P450